MPTRIAVPGISNNKLIQIIRTGQPSREGVSKMRAMIALRRSRSTQKAEVFSSLLANREELPRFRHMAVAGLLELGGAQAEKALIDNARYADEFTAPTLAQALGRIGSPDAMPTLRELQAAARASLKERVDFAISLLAYRHSLSGGEVRVPTGRQLLSIQTGARTLPVVVAAARPAEIKAATNALKREPLGIALTPKEAQRITCGPNGFLLVWNSDFAGPRLAKLRERKGVAGVLFLKSRFENDYSVSSLVLVTPGSRDVKISLHKMGGEAVFAGSVKFGSKTSADLVLGSVRRPGASAMKFSGTLTDGRLAIKGARSAAKVLKRKLPTVDTGR